MYACIHAKSGLRSVLLALAREFSPLVEETDTQTVVFSIDPLRKLIGSPHQIASEICRYGEERKLSANLAIACNVDTAILLARHTQGVSLVTPGEEQLRLAALPISALLAHDIPVDENILETLQHWGLKSCADLAALPEAGIAERLGAPGVYIRKLACGSIERPLRVPAAVAPYEAGNELEHPLGLIEPLLFLLGSVLNDLCRRLRAQSMAARSMAVQLELEQGEPYRCELEFPVPLNESGTLLKLLQLHLERHPPAAAVGAFLLRLQPEEPKRVQRGFFVPPAPPSDKLQVTVARIQAMVGKQNVGTPKLLNTHRPDAFELVPCHFSAEANPAQHDGAAGSSAHSLRLAMRLFRPALPARVRVVSATPKRVLATGVRGDVLQYAGPWKTSGEWWTTTAWNHEEWDVALDDGGLYRIYQEMQTREWYVHGVYD